MLCVRETSVLGLPRAAGASLLMLTRGKGTGACWASGVSASAVPELLVPAPVALVAVCVRLGTRSDT